MSPWLVALLAGVAFALLQYGGRDLRFGRSAILPALLRVAAIALLVGLLLDAAAGRQKPLSGWVALDASASWQRGGDAAAWREARREASAARPESLFLFGDSLRAVRGSDSLTAPQDLTSTARPAVERAPRRGHPPLRIPHREPADPHALRDP